MKVDIEDKKRDYLFAISELSVGGAEVGLVDVVNELSKTSKVDIVLYRKRGSLLEKLDQSIDVYAVIDPQKSKIRNLVMRVLYFLGGKCTRYVYKKTVPYKYHTEVSYLEGFPAVLVANSSNKESVKIASIRVGLKKHKVKASKLPGGDKVVRKAYRSMDHIYTVSQETTKEFIEIYPECESKTKTIYTYFNVNDIRGKSNEKMDIEFEKGNINFLSIGRFAEQKGYERLVEAFKEVHDQYPKAKLHLLGNYDNIYGEMIQNKISDYGLENAVLLHGVKNNPYPYMKNCDCLISSSYYEGYPRVVNEALAMGCLCLGTKVTGTVEALKNGEMGYLVEDNTEALFKGMCDVVEGKVSKSDFIEGLKAFDGNKKSFFDSLLEMSISKRSN